MRRHAGHRNGEGVHSTNRSLRGLTLWDELCRGVAFASLLRHLK